MKLGIKRLYDDVPMPAYQTAGASGIDLHAREYVVIDPGRCEAIGTGIALAIPEGHEGQVRPRSGMTRRGLVAELGTIDRDYTGEVRVLLANRTHGVQIVTAGDRIAQLVIAPVVRCEVVEVDELPTTERGAAGFGSTGTGVR